MPIGTRERQLNCHLGTVNNTRRRQLPYQGDPDALVLEATTISSVASTDSFDDSGNGLPTFKVGTPVEVQGLENGSAVYQVEDTAAGELGVLPNNVQDESAGAQVIVRSV